MNLLPNLLVVEMRRALHRRVVRVLILIALIGCAFAGVIAFTSSAGRTLAQMHGDGATHPAVMRDWWIAGSGDGALSVSGLFLLLGGLVGGASVAGAEWRAGTVTTVLTWEPRRVRLHLSRTAACGILAAVIAFALQIVFLASFLPATLANGSTAGLDAHWWIALVAAMLRVCLLTAIGAMLGVALATLGRNTAFALVAVFAWIVALEGVVRGLKPGLARFLWGENLTTVLTWAQLDNVSFRRGPLVALVTVALYVSVIIAAATLVFRRRDVASTS
jgi:ABC-type transport system involved in multi-copper enzyme maturation permease subunit